VHWPAGCSRGRRRLRRQARTHLHWAALSAYPCRCLPIILRAVRDECWCGSMVFAEGLCYVSWLPSIFLSRRVRVERFIVRVYLPRKFPDSAVSPQNISNNRNLFFRIPMESKHNHNKTEFRLHN
jgi:hypothetical protein